MSLNWELSPQDCFNCVSLFVDHLLILPPSAEHEGILPLSLSLIHLFILLSLFLLPLSLPLSASLIYLTSLLVLSCSLIHSFIHLSIHFLPPLSLLFLFSFFSHSYVIELMESALGSFFAGGLSQSLVNEYRAPVHLLARRFFFQLLRSHRFQKAFSLAVELSSRDLFMVREREGRREGEREGEREREGEKEGGRWCLNSSPTGAALHSSVTQ